MQCDAFVMLKYTGGAIMPTNAVTVRVSPEIKKRLEKLAKATKRSKSYLAAEAIEEYLTIQEWQVAAIEQGIKEAGQNKGIDIKQVRKKWEQRLADTSDS
jgi:predicted transcriptional regulator